MKILVLSINKPEFESRRKLISQKLAGYDWFFFDALDARNYSNNQISNLFDKDSFHNRYFRYPSSGEIGCTLSHIAMYRYIIDNDIPYALILEDDAIIDSDFKKFFIKKNLDVLMNDDSSIYLLGHSKVSRKNGFLYNFIHPLAIRKKIGDQKFGESKYMNLCGTVAYVVTNEAAKKILSSFAYRPFHLADDWLFINEVGINIFHSRPLLVLENYLSFESSIESERQSLQKVNNKNVVCRDDFFFSKKGIYDKVFYSINLFFKSIIKWMLIHL